MSTEIGTLLVRTPGTCGGDLRIDGTRITVKQIAVWFKQGYTAEEIVDMYPHLTLAPVYAAVAYYLVNRDEIEAELTEEERLGMELEQRQKASVGHTR